MKGGKMRKQEGIYALTKYPFEIDTMNVCRCEIRSTRKF